MAGQQLRLPPDSGFGSVTVNAVRNGAGS